MSFIKSPADDRIPAAAGGFHTTHWTVILTARDEANTAAEECLAQLCATYWHPLYSFVRRQGIAPHDAEDLTQAFFCHFLARNVLARVTPQGGKFRSYLLVCLKNFLAHQQERERAQRRGGGKTLALLDTADAETRYAQEAMDTRTPEAAYERRWAFAVIDSAIEELKREYGREGNAELFEHLQVFLPGGGQGLSRVELARQRGISVGAIDVAIHRLRRRFGVILRVKIAQTVSSPNEVEEELRHLVAVVAG